MPRSLAMSFMIAATSGLRWKMPALMMEKGDLRVMTSEERAAFRQARCHEIERDRARSRG